MKLCFPNIFKFTLKPLLIFIYRMTLLSPLDLCHVRYTECSREQWNILHNEEVDLCDLIHSVAFSILPQTAVYMDLWIIISTFILF